MEKRKPVMLDEDVYARLKQSRVDILKKTGKKLTFGSIIKKLLTRDLRLLHLDIGIKNYISLFVSKISLNKNVLGIMLFGSVAKGNFSKYSDIDIAIIANDSFPNAFTAVNKAIYSLKEEKKRLLEDRGLYLRINPLILKIGSLDKLEPIYFDLVDYGVPLFERGAVLTDFIDNIEKIKYSRKFTESGEVLEWKV